MRHWKGRRRGRAGTGSLQQPRNGKRERRGAGRKAKGRRRSSGIVIIIITIILTALGPVINLAICSASSACSGKKQVSCANYLSLLFGHKTPSGLRVRVCVCMCLCAWAVNMHTCVHTCACCTFAYTVLFLMYVQGRVHLLMCVRERTKACARMYVCAWRGPHTLHRPSPRTISFRSLPPSSRALAL